MLLVIHAYVDIVDAVKQVQLVIPASLRPGQPGSLVKKFPLRGVGSIGESNISES